MQDDKSALKDSSSPISTVTIAPCSLGAPRARRGRGSRHSRLRGGAFPGRQQGALSARRRLCRPVTQRGKNVLEGPCLRSPPAGPVPSVRGRVGGHWRAAAPLGHPLARHDPVVVVSRQYGGRLARSLPPWHEAGVAPVPARLPAPPSEAEKKRCATPCRSPRPEAARPARCHAAAGCWRSRLGSARPLWHTARLPPPSIFSLRPLQRWAFLGVPGSPLPPSPGSRPQPHVPVSPCSAARTQGQDAAAPSPPFSSGPGSGV